MVGPLTSAMVKVLSSTGLVLVKNCIIKRMRDTTNNIWGS